MEGLLEASKLLRSCLDRYITACSVVTTSYDLTIKGDLTSLLNGIEQELQTVATYEKDILNAKSMLAQKRNSSSTLVRMNTLPAEVLERIFQLAYRSWVHTMDLERVDTDYDEYADEPPEGFARYNMDIKLPSPMFPEAFVHVCSRWRQVALGSQNLWSRIDLPIFRQSYQLLLSRGKTFASRVAPSILDVHVLMANRDIISTSMCRRLDRYFASFGSQIRSLQLTNGIKPYYKHSYLETPLSASFPHLVPGNLQHLALIDHYPPSRMLLKNPEMRNSLDRYRTLPIKLPQQQLDEILRPIRSLWLKNHFFPWESPAYCGLVDLRLFSSGRSRLRPISIECAQLVDILSSCPGLRIFHCDIEVKGSIADVQGTGPIYLADLEDLNLCRMKYTQREIILPLLLPGQKPLSLSIQTGRVEDYYPNARPPEVLFSVAILDFFNRSNVTALYIRGHYSRDPLLKSLFTDSPASVRIIGLKNFALGETTALKSLEQSRPTRLDCLNLMSCSIEVDTLQEIIRVCPIQLLKLFFNNEETAKLDKLAAIVPVVKCIDSSAPIEEWNSWGIWEWDWGQL